MLNIFGGGMLEIVVLDGHALNPGDLDWSGMQAMGHCTFYDRTSPDLVVERAENAQVLIINKVIMNRETLRRLPRLRYIGLTATGYNVIDVKAAAELGITVTNIPAYSTQSVAQMTFALLLELTNRVGEHSLTVKQGDWSKSADFCYWKYPLHELSGRKLGIVGYGAIGRAVANIGRAFGMSIAGCRSNNQRGVADDGTELLPLAELLTQSDIISLHAPLSEKNYHLINAGTLKLMKPDALLINTARGGLIDAAALAAALNNDQLGGAGLDVLEDEPPETVCPLFSAKNCFITPHISWATKEARQRLMIILNDNLRKFLDGKVQNKVN